MSFRVHTLLPFPNSYSELALVVSALLCVCLVLPLNGAGEVDVMKFLNSSDQPTLAIRRDTRPAASVRVEIFRFGSERRRPLYTQLSDGRGEVIPRSLTPGKYHVVASTESNLRADLYLTVSPRSDAAPAPGSR